MANISVFIISDYHSGEQRTWKDERECIESLAKQDIQEPVDYVLCEDAQYEGTAPPDLVKILPGLRICYYPKGDSYSLKNAGVAGTSSEFIALLDADCQPSPNWLRGSLEILRKRGEIAAVSGRTVYPGSDLKERVLALLSRAYIDPGGPGTTPFLSNNGTVIRREVYARHPLPENMGAFSGRMQSEAILREGSKLWFEPSIQVVHEFEGWPMEADIRRNIGWGTVATRLEDPQLPYAGLVRFGAAAIPLVWAGKLWNLWRDTMRCHRPYGVRWQELPYALFLATYVSLMEVPGMWMAYQHQPITKTAYR